MATGGHFGFWLLTNSAAIFARVMGAKFFLNTSKSSNQVSNLTMLSVVTGPPDCTQLICVTLPQWVNTYDFLVFAYVSCQCEHSVFPISLLWGIFPFQTFFVAQVPFSYIHMILSLCITRLAYCWFVRMFGTVLYHNLCFGWITTVWKQCANSPLVSSIPLNAHAIWSRPRAPFTNMV